MLRLVVCKNWDSYLTLLTHLWMKVTDHLFVQYTGSQSLHLAFPIIPEDSHVFHTFPVWTFWPDCHSCFCVNFKRWSVSMYDPLGSLKHCHKKRSFLSLFVCLFVETKYSVVTYFFVFSSKEKLCLKAKK